MGERIILMTAMRFLHDLAAAVWIGGLIAMGLAVLPALRKKLGGGPQTRQLAQTVQGRRRCPGSTCW
jgi:putative copper export protein